MCAFVTQPHTIDPLYPGAVDEIVNLGDHWNDSYLRNHKAEIITLTKDISHNFGLCYGKLAEAGNVRRQRSSLVQARRDEELIEQTTQNLLEEIFTHQSPPVRHLFSSAVTPRGFINFTDAISRHYAVRYLLTGPAGCGKEKLLEAIASVAEERGHSLEVYHNTFSPQQIELIALPDLGVAVADVGDQPREIHSEDRVIDFNEFLKEANDPDMEAALQERFLTLVEEAAAEVAEAKSKHDTLESYYCKAMDFEAVDDTGNRVFNKILSLAADAEKR